MTPPARRLRPPPLPNRYGRPAPAPPGLRLQLERASLRVPRPSQSLCPPEEQRSSKRWLRDDTPGGGSGFKPRQAFRPLCLREEELGQVGARSTGSLICLDTKFFSKEVPSSSRELFVLGLLVLELIRLRPYSSPTAARAPARQCSRPCGVCCIHASFFLLRSQSLRCVTLETERPLARASPLGLPEQKHP